MTKYVTMCVPTSLNFFQKSSHWCFVGFKIFDEGKRQLTIDNSLAAKVKVIIVN